MQSVFICIALACALVYVKRIKALSAPQPDLPDAETVEKRGLVDDMVDELLMGLLEEQRELAVERAVSEKEKINMIVLGHVASGSDTTSDWLMEKLGARKDGAIWKFESEKYQVDVVEGPGSANFMRKMLSMEKVVDFAVLLVSAVDFAADISSSGLTSQHASLAQKLGISQIAVAVNEMDSTVPAYSEAKFLEVKQGMVNLLQTVGYDPKTIPYIPITSTNGDNILVTSTRVGEYGLKVV